MNWMKLEEQDNAKGVSNTWQTQLNDDEFGVIEQTGKASFRWTKRDLHGVLAEGVSETLEAAKSNF